MRVAAVVFLVIATGSFGAGESPSQDPSTFDIEPPLLIPNRSDDEPVETKTQAASPEGDIAKLEKEFDRAKKSATSAERFCKIGALSKVEVEQRTLRLARLESDLANARLALAKDEMLKKQAETAAGENAKANSSQVENTLALAIEAAHLAAANRDRAEVDAAEANVQRQKKLLAFGRVRKSDVARAEQKLADLRAGKN